MCPWSGSTLIRYTWNLKMSYWWTSFLSTMVFVTPWPWLPLDPSEPFCTHFISKHYPPFSIGTVLLVHLLRCTTMAMALSNKDVHQCLRRSSVHKHLAFGNSPNSVLPLLYSNLKLRYRYFPSLICCFMNSVKHISAGWRLCSAAWGNTIGSAWDSTPRTCAELLLS